MSITTRRLSRVNRKGAPTGTVIPAGADVAAIIAAGSANETFVLTADASRPYRITAPLPMKSGQTLISTSGAVIKGSVVVADWVQEAGSGLWYKDIMLDDYSNSNVQSNMTGYAYRVAGEIDQAQKLQDTYLDNIQLKRYMVKANVKSGGFYHDYTTGRTYLFDDPTGRTVEAAVAYEAIHAGVNIDSCTLDGITICHFASKPQLGAVFIEANGWEIRGCVFSYNHGLGLMMANVTNGSVHHNSFHHNGQAGMGHYRCSNTFISYNDFSFNNYMGDYYALDWESGAIKYACCHDCTFSYNTSHHNAGVGLWADIDNVGLVFDGNTIEDNESCGIRYEISFGAVISNNIVRRNGYGTTNGAWRTKDPSTPGQGDYFLEPAARS